ncbi:MAG: uncharacterized protein A8A55_2191 [Amphiamblys sp. WSBS2006]|nr:MAG: uncharacterized protein A8A55_2191 [Amphiamblys sp. WSBS2006]
MFLSQGFLQRTPLWMGRIRNAHIEKMERLRRNAYRSEGLEMEEREGKGDREAPAVPKRDEKIAQREKKKKKMFQKTQKGQPRLRNQLQNVLKKIPKNGPCSDGNKKDNRTIS